MKKPNIIFLLSDDHGSWATGAYGNKEVITPNIDRIAKEGIVFDNFFCASPVCSPARATILSGQIPSYHGVHDWLNGGNLKLADFQNSRLTENLYQQMIAGKQIHELDEVVDKLNVYNHPEYKSSVKREQTQIDYLEGCDTYVKQLYNCGYNCGLVGKWHLGATTKLRDEFNFWHPISKGGTNYKFPEIYNNGKIEVRSQYISEYIGDQALSFLDNQSNAEPFYLSVHFTAPHSPWRQVDHPARIWSRYQDVNITVEKSALHKDASYTAPRPTADQSGEQLLKGYYTAISAMDEQIGRILNQLESKGLMDNTIIVYTSDNGMNLGQHGIWGKGNGTFPLNFYEESIKVPFVISGPGIDITNKRQSAMLSHYDIYPTILDMLNIKLETQFPGRSFLPLLRGNKIATRDLVVFDEYGPNRMIRTNRYKLITRHDHSNDEMYDLKHDPNERDNMLIDMKKHQKLYDNLKSRMEQWFAKHEISEYSGIKTKVTGFGQFEKMNRVEQPFERIDDFY